MATPTLTTTGNITVIDDGESTANWVGDSFSLDPDIKVAGSNSVSCALTTNGVNEIVVLSTCPGASTFASGATSRLWLILPQKLLMVFNCGFLMVQTLPFGL